MATTVSPDDARALAREVLASRAGAVAEELRPAIRIDYRRTTLVDLDHGERVTIDRLLRFTDCDGTTVGGIEGGLAVVETKSTAPRAEVARTLWSCGARPLRTTKYTAAVALAGRRRALPDSVMDLRRFFATGPSGSAQDVPGSA